MFKKDDLVWLDTRNLRMERPSKKLAERYVGPFRITEIVSPVACRLDLPRTMGNHDVFHTNLLRSAATDSLPGQRPSTQSRVVTERDRSRKRWMIKEVLGSRITKNRQGKVRLEYYIRWKGGLLLGSLRRIWYRVARQCCTNFTFSTQRSLRLQSYGVAGAPRS